MFCYEFYSKLLEEVIKNGYKPVMFKNYDTVFKPAIIRHDIDMSPKKALKIAELEHSMGVRSTYFTMISSNYYNILSKENINYIKSLIQLNHEVGLHYDYTKYPDTLNDLYMLIETVKKEISLLENILDEEIYSFSWHIPNKKLLGKHLDLMYNGREIFNAYDCKFIHDYKYLSDSMMQWREPVMDIIKSNEYEKLQILTHPIWYTDNGDMTSHEIIGKEVEYRKNDLFDYANLILPGFNE